MAALDAIRGALFEQAVLPLLYGLGLMAFAEPAYQAMDAVMLGAVQIGLAFVLFRPLERWRPGEAWTNCRAVRVDVLYTALERLGVMSLVFFFTLRPLVEGLDAAARQHGYIPPNLEDVLPSGFPGQVMAFGIYLVVIDLADYLYHRLQHRFDSWWALHSVHHSQRQLSFWADDRHHVLDGIVREGFLATLALAIGVPGIQFVGVVFVTRLVESLSHANARLSFGRLGERLVVSPRYHRIHHGMGIGHEGRARGCNFATLFPMWDMVFGTAKYNLQARGDVTFTPSVKGFLRGGYNNQELDGPFLFQEADTAIVDVATGLDIDAGQVGLFNVRGFYANENFHVDNVSVPEPTLSFVSNAHHTTSNDYGLSGQWSKKLGVLDSRLTAGVDFRRIQGEDDQDVFNTPGVLSAKVIGEGDQTSVGVFGELSVTPLRGLELLGNLRFDYFLNSAGQIITNGVSQSFPDQDLTIVSPRFAARYQIAEPIAVRGAYYQGFRAPTLAELYRSFESPTFRGCRIPT